MFKSHDPIFIWFINVFLVFPTLICTVGGPTAGAGLGGGTVSVPVYIH